MSDYNDFLLPEPCLRMDTHFGDEYESVEFGDGTGYVKAVPTLARLGALHVELDELLAENAKLRKLAEKLIILAFARCADCDLLDASCALAPMQKCLLWNECESLARELGVEVDS